MSQDYNQFVKFKNTKAIVCDLDGTLYLDGKPLPGAHDFLNKIISTNRKLYYFTNNTSQSRQTYLDKLDRLNFPVSDDMLITSADCADNYLKKNRLFPDIYLVGNKDLKTEFVNRGYSCLSEEQVVNVKPLAVVLGFDTELTYQKIHTCYDLILKDIPFIATHADLLCPVSKNVFKPDVGSFISMFETATNGIRPKVVGKPNKEAVDAISDKAQLPPNEIAFIGDRLYTDIRMAQSYNMIGVLVFSGETTREMLATSGDKPLVAVDGVVDLIQYL